MHGDDDRPIHWALTSRPACSATSSITSPGVTAVSLSGGSGGMWAENDYERALEQLKTLAGELRRSHPGEAASLRGVMAETLSVTRVGITGSLKKTLASTSPCASMIERLRRTARNVKYRQNGEMCWREGLNRTPACVRATMHGRYRRWRPGRACPGRCQSRRAGGRVALR